MFGYSTEEEVQSQGGSYGKFGLNHNAKMTKFEFNENAGKDGVPGEALDITYQVEEKEYRQRFYPINKVFREGKDQTGEITDTNSEEYKEAVKRDATRLSAILTSIASCFVEEEVLKTSLSRPFSSFKEYVATIEGLIKRNPDWTKVNLDIFLQYQWQPRGEMKRTFLELPCSNGKLKQINQGSFITVTDSTAKWSKDDSKTSLNYLDESGNVHLFKRSAWFMESNFAKPIILEEDPTPTGDANGFTTGSTEGATPKGW